MKKLIAVLLLLTSVNSAQAIELGEGYVCTAREILRQGKYRKPSVEKTRLKGKIAAQKERIEALKVNKKKNKTKIAAANITISEFKSIIKDIDGCAKGVFSVLDFYTSLSGRYTGLYSASLGTFSIDGTLLIDFFLLGDDVTIDIEFGGKLGELVPTSKTRLAFNINGKTFPTNNEFLGTTLGDVVLKVDEKGAFNMTSTNMPNQDFNQGILNFDGKFKNGNKNFEGLFSVGSKLLPGVFLLNGELKFQKN